MANGPIEAMWAEFADATGVDSGFTAWGFGDDSEPEFRTSLALLVRDGPKRATASLLAEYHESNEPLPSAGEFSVILDGAGEPVCIIKTTQVEVRAFSEVDEAFAWDEGEGERNLEWWRDAHRDEFQKFGIDLTDSTEMVLERFDLMWPQ